MAAGVMEDARATEGRSKVAKPGGDHKKAKEGGAKDGAGGGGTGDGPTGPCRAPQDRERTAPHHYAVGSTAAGLLAGVGAFVCCCAIS